MFQIHDKDGNAVDINILDKEACDLWGTEIDNKHKGKYASPSDIPEVKAQYFAPEYKGRYSGELSYWIERQNWFDWIGWKIAQGNTSWEALKEEVLEPYRKHGEEMMEYIKTEPRIWGFIELIALWESKGYIPVSMDGDYNILSKNGIRTATLEETTNI